MDKFEILAYSIHLDKSQQEQVVRTFFDFYHEQTPKHQKRIRLNWIFLPGRFNGKIPEKWVKAYEIPDKVMRMVPFEERTVALESSSVVLHPSGKEQKQVVPEAFKYRIPVVVTEETDLFEEVPINSGVLLKEKSGEFLTAEITRTLEMLYYDPEALKILSKGAEKEYERLFGWGLKEFRSKQ